MSRVTVLRLGRMDYPWAHQLQRRWVHARREERVGDLLLVVEHPPVITFGRGGGQEDLQVAPGILQRMGVRIVQTERGGRATYHGPGQLVFYPILKLGTPVRPEDPHAYLWKLEEAAIRCLEQFGIQAERKEGLPGVWVGEEKIAAIGIALQEGVTYHGLALNVNPDLSHFRWIIPCGLVDKGVTSMARLLGHPIEPGAVEAAFLEAFSRIFHVTLEFGFQEGPWLIAPPPMGERIESLYEMFHNLRLHTVCEEALCPNVGTCWGEGTATFMVLGDTCTRHCRFCAVSSGRPLPPDPMEPEHLAEAAARMGLSHVVITMVARDDLPDGGAAHLARVITAVRRRLPQATVEILISDLGGSLKALDQVVKARPDVLAHNMETVPRLYPMIQPHKDYRRSLGVLAWAKRAGLLTKSGLILGMGETRGEVLEVLRDLRGVGCDILTLGQYLQPTSRNRPVVEYIHPEEFAWYAEIAEALGFRAVAAGPLVRSSYRAASLFHQALRVNGGQLQRSACPMGALPPRVM